ncbi:MAG: Asp23/Gls24 family envelope stress response protein [Firmicutes bacterium]|nr:Asp23/Gls24 family envelope stress response protein [Bacillota bacterium]
MSDVNNNEVKNESANSVTSVRISDDVVATIAAIAAVEIEGVGGMCGTRAGEIIEKLGKKNSGKGVKVDVDGNNVKITLNMLVIYGHKIQAVCAEVQEAVKASVEGMTGLHVSEITVVVQGILTPQDAKDAE